MSNLLIGDLRPRPGYVWSRTARRNTRRVLGSFIQGRIELDQALAKLDRAGLKINNRSREARKKCEIMIEA